MKLLRMLSLKNNNRIPINNNAPANAAKSTGRSEIATNSFTAVASDIYRTR